MEVKITPRHKRYFWSISVGLSTLMLIGVILLLVGTLSGCMTYEKARLRYSTDKIDTTFQTVTTRIHGDTIYRVFKTDTTRYVEKVKQGRATVTIIREPTNTTIIANCDSISKSQKVPLKIVTQKWGVDPRFERQANTWKTVAFLLMGLLGVGVIVYIFTHKFQIIKRT